MNKQKPMILAIEDFKIELEQTINSLLQKHQLPLYLVEPMFINIARTVNTQAQQEILMAREEYERGEKENETKCTNN